MTTQTHRLRQAICAAILLGTASVTAFANPSSMPLSSPKMALCYCHCDHADKCKKMCELPQYQNRWWAVSCQKKSVAVKGLEAPASNSGSRKTNRPERASL
jgi:hypothetical protein